MSVNSDELLFDHPGSEVSGAEMSQLFENAVASLRMGVEDFQQSDSDRALSAVRNFYAGLLLLAKEVLVRQAPEAEMDDVIGAKYEPVPDGDGGVVYQMVGNQTIDFNTIAKRFKDFGLKIESAPLTDLNRIRNDIEHRYTNQSGEAVREAIAKAFPTASALFRLADEDPAEALGDVWGTMIETRHLYEAELARCKKTLATVEWRSSTVAEAELHCPDCGSHLIEQAEPENRDQDLVELYCLACRNHPETTTMIVEVLQERLAGETYVRFKDAGEEGPIHICPQCWDSAYVDFEDGCANCGHSIDSAECARCSTTLSIEEIAYGDGTGFCSYCAHMAEKVMRE